MRRAMRRARIDGTGRAAAGGGAPCAPRGRAASAPDGHAGAGERQGSKNASMHLNARCTKGCGGWKGERAERSGVS
jgi:hypothetical protein